MKNSLFVVGSAAALLFAAVLPAYGAYIHGGQNVLVDSAQTVANTNVYVGGGNVSVSVPVGGDLFAGGGTVNISGRVQGDLFAGGGTLIILGASAEDMRIGGGSVTLGSEVRGELLAAGGQLTILPETKIAKEAYMTGGNIVFEGTASDDMELAGGTIRVNGIVNGDLIVRGTQELSLGPKAVVRGKFEYSAPKAAVIEPGAVIGGETIFHQIETRGSGSKNPARALLGLITFFWFVKFIAVLAAAYLLWFLRREDAMHIMTRGTSKFWHELFIGFATLILMPVFAILLAITVVGLIPGVLLGFTYAILLILAKPAAVLLAGAVIARRTTLAWYHVLLGLLALEILSFIPFVGWIIACAVYLAALGSLTETLKLKFHRGA